MSLLRLFLPAVLLLGAAQAAASETLTLAPELWDRPRSARAVLDEPAVRRAVSAYLARRDVALVIHHPPGTVPALQAEELRAWLVALAVESAHVSLKSDLEPNVMLKIEVVSGL
jgi:hypothetical protein